MRGVAGIAAYILSALLNYYNCAYIVHLFVLLIYYDATPYCMSSTFNSIVYFVFVVAQVIALDYIYAHEPVLILVLCFTYLILFPTLAYLILHA